MKKISLFLLACFSFFSMSAQWLRNGNHIYNDNTGNVGIRFTTPVYPFQIWDGGTNVASGIGFLPGNNSAENAVIKALKTSGYGLVLRAENHDAGKGQAGIFIRSNDGLTLPAQVSMLGNQIEFRTGLGYADAINDGSPGVSALFINNEQKVGIGTTSPGSFKLAVEGKIGAREIQVTLDVPWPDYVFKKTYQPMSLASLENFVKKNNHLPNIPSAQEVKEKGGIELGEMNGKLLEKIEELTLYMFDVNKRIEQMNRKIASMEKENKALKRKMLKK